jgi:hypothetical protein
MKGYRFYLEFKSATRKRKGLHVGTCIALCTDERAYISGGEGCQGAIVGVFDAPNSPVAYTSVGLDYLRETCKRISEKKAREIHPALFDRIVGG